ncbi:hypothetical protein [Kushneria sp. EE4]
MNREYSPINDEQGPWLEKIERLAVKRIKKPTGQTLRSVETGKDLVLTGPDGPESDPETRACPTNNIGDAIDDRTGAGAPSGTRKRICQPYERNPEWSREAANLSLATQLDDNSPVSSSVVFPAAAFDHFRPCARVRNRPAGTAQALTGEQASSVVAGTWQCNIRPRIPPVGRREADAARRALAAALATH